ncbi:hypothetical protein M407DRAFT_33050 [Tulasnella calospora MUT 4182]|uniref:Uncharacterized protein n=1 Tax=Tulasnella calospora MUT 4182 TaxID=1051891 RepID=A0A0C3Q310_9AGAM|nr:hypothetical protein M407DRAFT_33050 [Tulasnella calospora MUT 4182]
MKLSILLITSLSFIPSLIAAVAIPDVAPRNETLAKRGGEVNYLSNCQRLDVNTLNSYTASYVAWYANVDNSQSGSDRPDSLSNEYRNWDAGGDYLHWEGQQQNIYFSDSGVTVQTHINSNAQSLEFTAYAGWAQRTSDGKVFNCYKDNSRQLFIWGLPVPDGTNRGIICQAIYWCV